jgi:hypothetical protein
MGQDFIGSVRDALSMVKKTVFWRWGKYERVLGDALGVCLKGESESEKQRWLVCLRGG